MQCPAIEFEIFTYMKNVQDILYQKCLPYSPLWYDSGVYRLAKEKQLKKPDESSNIILGIGGFHTGNVELSLQPPKL